MDAATRRLTGKAKGHGAVRSVLAFRGQFVRHGSPEVPILSTGQAQELLDRARFLAAQPIRARGLEHWKPIVAQVAAAQYPASALIGKES